MTMFIELTGINLDRERQAVSLERATNRTRRPDFGGDAELADAEDAASLPPPSPNDTSPVYYPTMIQVDEIRDFYPRRSEGDGTPRTGTRIVFRNSAASPVKESYEEVKARVLAATSGGGSPAAAARSRGRRAAERGEESTSE